MATDGNKRLLEEFAFPTYEEWREAAEKALKGVPFDKKMYTKTLEGITLQPIYTKDDIDKIPYTDSDFPGFYPYTRGGSASGYKKMPWKISQELPYPEPEKFNEAAVYDLERGQDALNIRINKNSALHSQNESEVIDTGLYLSHKKDLEKAFKGIDLSKVPVYFDSGDFSPAAAAIFKAYLDERNIPANKAQGSFDYDPIASLAANGRININFEKTYDLMASYLKWADENLPGFKLIAANGSAFHNAGVNAVQELAYAIASGVEYIREMQARSIDIEKAAKKIRFKFSAGPHFFMEIAKFRAARAIWARIVKEFGGSGEAQKMSIHAETSNMNISKYDPYVNLLRNTTETLSIVLGGCDSVHVRFLDEQYGMPTEFSRHLSRNTQIIIREEAHVNDTVDPAAGSWFLETLTHSLMKTAWQEFQNIESNGGMSKVLLSGKIKSEVEKVIAERIKNLSLRKDTLLGTNKYANLMEKPVKSHGFPGNEVLESRIAAFNEATNSRDKDKVYRLLRQLESMELSEVNFLNTALEATREGAGIGEIMHNISRHSEPVEAEALPQFRAGAIFEEIRGLSEAYKVKTGEFPKVYLANFGQLKEYKARADFAADFFQVGGFQFVSSKGFDNTDGAKNEFVNSGIPVVVICSTDDKYPAIVPSFCAMVKKEKPEAKIVLAGYPKDYIDEFKKSGVDYFIHMKANIYEILSEIQKETGLAEKI